MTPQDKEILRQMRAEVQRLATKVDGIRGPAILRNDRNSIVVAQPRQAIPRPRPQATGSSLSILKITGSTSPATLGGGFYWALLQKRNSTAWTPTSTSSTSSFYQNVGTSTDYIIVWNLLESGATTHNIAANQFVLATDAGDTATVSGTDYAVYLMYGISLSC